MNVIDRHCLNRETGSRHDARRAATRQDILAAAEELILAHGIRGLRTRDLVERSGVSERTVFNHFGSIEETALARIEDYLTPLFCDLGVPPETPVQRLPEVMREHFLANLRSSTGRRHLTGFIHLAAALNPDSGDLLARHVVLTLTRVATESVDQVQRDHPGLQRDQHLRLRIYMNNLAHALGFGLVRCLMREHSADVCLTTVGVDQIPRTEDLWPHIEWAVAQVDAGTPRL